MKTADFLVERIAGAGVDHVFGVGGANIEDVLAAVAAHPRMQAVIAKHEFSAAAMADGYARAGGGLGVVVATSGGGALNLVPALAEALASCVPVLALVGQPPRAREGRGAFQDTSGRAGAPDAEAVFAGVSRFCRRVGSAQALPGALEEALRAARGPNPGPAVLLIPKDVQRAHLPSRRVWRLRRPVRLPEPAEALRLVAARLTTAAGRPGGVLVVAGSGVARHGARAALAALVERLDARVALAPDARDVFDNRSPRFLGVTGVMGHAAVRTVAAEAAAILVVGTRLPDIARAGLEQALAARPVVRVHFEPPFEGDPGEAWLAGDVRAALEALAERVPPVAAAEHGAGAPPQAAPLDPPSGAAAFVSALHDALPEGAGVFIDAGNTGAVAVHHLNLAPGGRTAVALGMGGMGYSFGAAIGAACATRRRSFVLAGDGAFFMHGLEVHTALEHGLPVTFVLFDNAAHGMCVQRERALGVPEDQRSAFRHCQLAAGLAAMFPDLPALECATPAALFRAARESCRRAGPTVLTVRTDAAEVPPFALNTPAALAAHTPFGACDANRRKQAV